MYTGVHLNVSWESYLFEFFDLRCESVTYVLVNKNMYVATFIWEILTPTKKAVGSGHARLHNVAIKR